MDDNRATDREYSKLLHGKVIDNVEFVGTSVHVYFKDKTSATFEQTDEGVFVTYWEGD